MHPCPKCGHQIEGRPNFCPTCGASQTYDRAGGDDPLIGRLIDNYAKDARIPEMFLAALVSSLFGVVVFVCFGLLSNRVLRDWHDSAAR